MNVKRLTEVAAANSAGSASASDPPESESEYPGAIVKLLEYVASVDQCSVQIQSREEQLQDCHWMLCRVKVILP